MHTVTLYSRPGCHLCDEAEVHLRAFAQSLGFTVEKVDIESDPALDNAYRWAIPVIVLDGHEVARAPIRPGALEAALRQALAEGREP